MGVMSLPPAVSREQWLAARRALLEEEKALTRARDAVNTKLRLLPMVELDKEYVFDRIDDPGGEIRMPGLFEGRRQLIVYHAMWLDDRGLACPSCSAFLDQVGYLAHLRARDTVFAAVSRGPVGQMRAFKARMGWTFPWYSSRRSDFNYDFHVSFDEARAPIEYNNRAPQAAAPFGAGRTAQAPAVPIKAAPPADAATSHRPVGGRSRHDRMLAATSSASDNAPAAAHALADPGEPGGRSRAA